MDGWMDGWNVDETVGIYERKILDTCHLYLVLNEEQDFFQVQRKNVLLQLEGTSRAKLGSYGRAE